MQAGDLVRVKAPFNERFPDVYTVAQVFEADGEPAAMLEEPECGFLLIYLEAAA